MSGVVVQVGSNVHNIPVGSKVAVNPALDDQHYDMEPCTTCAIGKRNIHKRFASYGLSAPGGGFATGIVAMALNCIVLPDAVSLQVGALLGPLAVAWHCIRTSGFKNGQKKSLAKELGADVVVDSLEGSEPSNPALSAVHQAALESGNLPAHKMITSVVPLEDVVKKGFHALMHSNVSHVNILVQPRSCVGEVS
ncbi:hypothetical protein BDV37DRAFT_286787 [Aspergillus pseudonomiae]|uniref:Alcohol dehydrogenase-like N-terminal domain-containing protein n=1 Tax=Aspergillus pseudonomiae TaxID=1506151 RepID=A0A5N7D1J2_9EURO|nr:uncharacterized protein BDV37DRAFT_286787 [Aspergillus pseudonomiae]KAE8400290.1 hypothetical protein BDV37DRAFT_286787 [Aspergillus pseudonomiae]